MLDTLGGGNQARVTHFIVRFLLYHLRPFLKHAFHPFTLGASRRLIIAAKNLLQTNCMFFGLFKMLFETGRELSLLAALTILGRAAMICFSAL